MQSDEMLHAMPRLSHWECLRDLWGQQVPVDEMSILLVGYIKRIYREEGSTSKSLIAPLRWLALLCHMRGDYDNEIRVLSRTVGLLQLYFGKHHPHTEQVLIKLLSVVSGSDQHLTIVRYFLVQRQDRLVEMRWRLMQAFVMALYVPCSGKTDSNREALQLLQQYVMHHLRFGSLPLASLSQAVELLWYITDEFGGHSALVPIARLLANKLSDIESVDAVAQIARLRRFVDEVQSALSMAQQRKIRPPIALV